MKGPQDPVDHARTTRSHAGETMKDNRNMPALLVVALGLVLFVGCLTAFASGSIGVGVLLALLALIGVSVGSLWLAAAHRRARDIERRWYDGHPDVKPQEPNS